MLTIGKLEPSDRAPWEELFRGYMDFYERTLPQAMYDRAWKEFANDTRMHALGARLDGRLVGITHFLFHTGIWSPCACYLEDLFVEPAARGRGLARALIEAVAKCARTEGAGRRYWLTHETNATARALYDKVAEKSGFLVYRKVLA